MDAADAAGGPVVVDATTLPPRPWHNGAGTTRQVWTAPGWRLSIADLTTPGPFSDLPGVDRVHVPLGGAYTLAVDGRPVAARALEPIAFPGEAAVSLDDLPAPTRALNLMVWRDHGRGEVRVTRHDGAVTWPSAVRAVVLVAGGASLPGATDPLPAPTAVVAGEAPLTLDLHDATVAEIHLRIH
ncbi:HutD family protein [Nocardioides sp. YIM 152588]|uniref:HutD/Ves family protein n=1 Tax=Nocardioides sp. YIM 152588 TaxID=3158259 RepID=UPI0032E3D733